MTRAMNIYEITECAKEHGFDSLEFLVINQNGGKFKGKFLDAYYGFVLIPEISEGFFQLDDLVKEFGFDFFSFIPLKVTKDQ